MPKHKEKFKKKKLSALWDKRKW